MFDNLTATQVRCTELEEEVRMLRLHYREMQIDPGLRMVHGSMLAVQRAVIATLNPQFQIRETPGLGERALRVSLVGLKRDGFAEELKQAISDALPVSGIEVIVDV